MRDLPWIKNAPLTVHMVDAIATATIFLFQIATLVASINDHFGEKIVLLKRRRRTYEAQARRTPRRGPGMRGPRSVKPN